MSGERSSRPDLPLVRVRALRKQPSCDGSHRGTEFTPISCGRPKRRGTAVLWLQTDTHRALLRRRAYEPPGGSPLDDPHSDVNRAIGGARARRRAGAAERRVLLFSPELAAMSTRGSLRYCYMVSGEFGALYQTQLFLEVTGEASPVMTLGDRDVILFSGVAAAASNISGAGSRSPRPTGCTCARARP